MKKFDYYQPRSLVEAHELMERFHGRAKYVAGGTDVIVRLKQRVIQPDVLISLRRVEGLAGIKRNGGISLGSMTLLRDIERDPDIARHYPALIQAVWVLANPQIRNVATVGGNLSNAAPSADCAPPLMVMEATVVLQGPGGERKIPVEEFFTGPGQTCLTGVEVLREIRIPDKRAQTGMAFLKTGRVSQDIAVANAAALLVMKGRVCRTCRLAVGAVAPVPLRLRNVEEVIEGEEVSPELLDRVGQRVEREVRPITDVRATAEYRKVVAGVLVKRAIRKAVESVSKPG
jgi:carbon-monoxide dehydrogenase medium subunit